MNELLKMHFAAPVNQAFLVGRSDVDEMQQLCGVAHYSCRFCESKMALQNQMC